MTGMALAHCILGKFLGVVCHCFPHTYIYVYVCVCVCVCFIEGNMLHEDLYMFLGVFKI